MSRMAALILIGMAFPASAADPIEVYRDKTSAEPRCKAAAGSEIVICGRRLADRYRVPFLVPTPGDPKMRGVPAERSLLLAQQTACEALGPFLVGCGAVGVSVSTKVGSGKIEYRPLAP
jgi:hypothetical protein